MKKKYYDFCIDGKWAVAPLIDCYLTHDEARAKVIELAKVGAKRVSVAMYEVPNGQGGGFVAFEYPNGVTAGSEKIS